MVDERQLEEQEVIEEQGVVDELTCDELCIVSDKEHPDEMAERIKDQIHKKGCSCSLHRKDLT